MMADAGGHRPFSYQQKSVSLAKRRPAAETCSWPAVEVYSDIVFHDIVFHQKGLAEETLRFINADFDTSVFEETVFVILPCP